MVLIITNNNVWSIFIYIFYLNSLSVGVFPFLEFFPTLAIKILISFQKNIYVKIARSFFSSKGVSKEVGVFKNVKQLCKT